MTTVYKYMYGDKGFTSQKQIHESMRNYLDNHKQKDIIDFSNDLWIYKLFENHPNASEKLNNMKHIMIGLDPYYKNKCFYVVYNNDTKNDISFKKCIYVENTYSMITKALRDDILYQISEYRGDIFKNNKSIKCEETGKELYNDHKTHIDHNYRIKTFIQIINDFCKENNINVREIKTLSKGILRTIKENKIRELWQVYHKNNAVLRAIDCDNNVRHK